MSSPDPGARQQRMLQLGDLPRLPWVNIDTSKYALPKSQVEHRTLAERMQPADAAVVASTLQRNGPQFTDPGISPPKHRMRAGLSDIKSSGLVGLRRLILPGQNMSKGSTQHPRSSGALHG